MLVVCCKFIFPFMAYHWFPNYKNTMVAISSRAGTAHPARAPGCTHGFNEFQVVHSFFFFVVIYKSLFGLLLAIVLSVSFDLWLLITFWYLEAFQYFFLHLYLATGTILLCCPLPPTDYCLEYALDMCHSTIYHAHC